MPPRITSPQNVRVKNAIKLRTRRGREKQDRILIDGTREITRAIAGNVHVLEAFVCPSQCRGSASRQLLTQLKLCGVPLLEVTPAVLAKLAFGERAEGVLAVGRTPRRDLQDWVPEKSALVAVLEGFEKPGNLGAVMRSADGAGLAGVIVADARTDLFNPNVIRASLGTVFTVPVYHASSSEALQWLRDAEMKIYTARVDAYVRYTDVSYRKATAIVLGSEAHGLSSLWQSPEITAVALPMQGTADSLNVSATAAVLFYEALRQRALVDALLRGR